MSSAAFSTREGTRPFKALTREPETAAEEGLSESTDAYAIFPSDTGEFARPPETLAESSSWAALEEALHEASAQLAAPNLSLRVHRSFPKARRAVLFALDAQGRAVVVDEQPVDCTTRANAEGLAEDVCALMKMIALAATQAVMFSGSVLVLVVRDGDWVSVTQHSAARLGLILAHVDRLRGDL